MGYYINPEYQTKEQWLSANGVPECVNNPALSHIAPLRAPRWEDRCPEHTFVVLVSNGNFTAAAIAYDEGEFKAFNYPDDTRPAIWFQVPNDKLIEMEPSLTGRLS